MLGPIAIDKGGLLTILWERRLAIDPDLIAVCLFAGLGLTAALTLASCGRHLRRLGWTLWRISSRSTFMHRFFLRGTKQVSSASLIVTRLTFVSGLLV